VNAPAVHLGERLQDVVDNRLGAAELEQARSHLAGCARCRRELAALRRVRGALAPRPGQAGLPPALGVALMQALDREDAAAQAPPSRRRIGTVAAWGWALAACLVAAMASALLLWPGRTAVAPQPWTAAVAREFDAYRDARLPLSMKTGEVAELERFFSASDLGFHTRVFDLGMMNYRIEGGAVRRLGDRPSALYVYRGPDDARLLCEMFQGRLDELPPAPRTASHNGIDFRIYREGALTAVYWAEGDVICVLVSDIDSEAVLALAFAKAAPAA
jgi:anti-sigma factor RsiW